MSASHRPSGVKHVRPSTTTVSMSLTSSCFSSESAPTPFHHGIRRRGGTIPTGSTTTEGRRACIAFERRAISSRLWLSGKLCCKSWVIAVNNLASSGHGIIPEYFCFHLQFSKAMLENVANANDPHELIAVLDGQMANAPLRHQLHHIGDAILG
jgi:hypothetical protein